MIFDRGERLVSVFIVGPKKPSKTAADGADAIKVKTLHLHLSRKIPIDDSLVGAVHTEEPPGPFQWQPISKKRFGKNPLDMQWPDRKMIDRRAPRKLRPEGRGGFTQLLSRISGCLKTLQSN